MMANRIARILPSFDHSRIQLSKDSKIDRQHPLLAIFDYLPEKDLMHSNRFWHGFVIDSRTPQPEEILFSQRGSFRWNRKRDGMPRTLRILDYREIGRQLERWWSGNFALKLPIDLPSNRSELAQIISSFESLISHLMGNRKQLDQQSPLDHPIFSQYRQSPAQSDIVINLTK
jgi:hypothetical protein